MPAAIASSPQQRKRFVIQDDLFLLREVQARNPFAGYANLAQIAASVNVATSKDFSPRGARERCDYLLRLYEEQNQRNLRKTAVLGEGAASTRDTGYGQGVRVPREVWTEKHSLKETASEKAAASAARDAAPNKRPLTRPKFYQQAPVRTRQLLLFLVTCIMSLMSRKIDELTEGTTDLVKLNQRSLQAALQGTTAQPKFRDGQWWLYHSHEEQRGRELKALSSYSREPRKRALKEKAIALENRRLALEETRLAFEQRKFEAELEDRSLQRQHFAAQQAAQTELLKVLVEQIVKRS